MAPQAKHKVYKIKLNSISKLEELLQEIYNQACQLIVMTETEMNKLSQSTILSQTSDDIKMKYAKAINDFINTKEKAITKKFEVAKFMGDMIRYQGNAENAIAENMAGDMSLNWNELKDKLEEEGEPEDKENRQVYTFRKKS